eukprot:5302849-Amphidinium_carterae.1
MGQNGALLKGFADISLHALHTNASWDARSRVEHLSCARGSIATLPICQYHWNAKHSEFDPNE